MDLLFCGDLGNRFIFFQELLDHLGFEIGCMLFPHACTAFCGSVMWDQYTASKLDISISSGNF